MSDALGGDSAAGGLLGGHSLQSGSIDMPEDTDAPKFTFSDVKARE